MCTILQQANKPIKKRFQSFLSPPLLKFVISATTATDLHHDLFHHSLLKFVISATTATTILPNLL